MTTKDNRNYRKLSRDFKNKIKLIKRIPLEDNINLFFEICDLNLRNYIDTEKKMIEFVEKLIDRTDDEKIKFMLKYIAADESRHHRTLIEIMNNIVIKETITDAEWEDLLYKEAIAHGTPGG